MQVNSVSSMQSFGNKRMASPEQILSWIANANDKDLKQLAYKQTNIDVEDRKHRRIDNALYFAMPLSSAVAYAVNPSNMSRIGRLGTATKLGALFTLPFATVAGAFALKNSINKHNEKAAIFSANHPVLTSIAALAGGLAAAAVVRGGASKLIAKYGEQIAAKAAPAVEKLAKGLDSSKVLNFASKQLAKMPSALKEFSKKALSWSPYLILGAQIGHMLNHQSVKTQQYYKNYETLKTAQEQVRAMIDA